MIKLPNVPNFAKQSFSSFADWFIADGGQIVNLINSIYYRIYFQTDSQLIQIPVNPNSIKVECLNDVESFNSITKGPAIKPKNRKLRKTSFESVFLKNYSDPLNNPGVVLPPHLYINFFNDLLNNLKPFKFMCNSVDAIVGLIRQDNYNGLLDSFEWEERGGEPGDIYYKISVIEYSPLNITVRNDENNQNNNEVKNNNKKLKILDNVKGEYVGKLYDCNYPKQNLTNGLWMDSPSTWSGKGATLQCVDTNGAVSIWKVVDGPNKGRFYGSFVKDYEEKILGGIL